MLLELREYILLSLKELPLIATAGPLFLGLSQGNVNLVLFALGTAIIASTAAGLVGWLLKWPLDWLGVPFSIWKVNASDVSNLLPDTANTTRGTIDVVPTYWFTMSVFFFSYLAYNAITLYKEPTTTKTISPDTEEKVENRKNQAIMSLVLIITIGIAILLANIWLSGSETVLGVLVGFVTGAGTAYGWFQFLKRCGMGRVEDVFGIQARMLPESANLPVVCLPA